MSLPSSASSPARDIDQQALDWFVRRGRGLSVAEAARFEAWLAADPANADALARWESDWTALDALPEAGIAALKRELAAQQAREAAGDAAGAVGEARGSRAARPGFWARWTSRRSTADARVRAYRPRLALIGAALAMSAAVSVGWWTWERPTYVQSFATARGGELDVRLPDGSRLKLDTATHLSVAFRRGRREVRLADGQAYFEVEHDGSRPFDVFAGASRMTDLGTRFSVRYTPGIPGNGDVQVAVEQGSVRVGHVPGADPIARVLAGEDAEAVILTAGQQVSCDPAGAIGTVTALEPSAFAIWRDGRVSFDDTPLSQALAEFERYGPTHLALAGPDVAALRITGTFNPRHIENFMRVLPKVQHVVLQPHGETTDIALSPR
ncbi:FecR family protein [Pararobbsia silviterrae]|uniref:DUF4880 domain-containing protein n=1 Tax=Pararobbsia silviterrae TaxID=1792498 RepID=A0A494XF48_9BURK|nr:FecR domain-containing protein [Pararobbsia silviterrae]RKP47106.1 DUF4880 domain-containing protein [Pararobbsia silviterrae]